jgi:hypothetical protein
VAWPEDIDQPCGLHVSELTTVLDRLVPLRPVVFRRRPTDPWFDAQCRQFKRATRRLERVYLAACRRCRPLTDSIDDDRLGRAVAAVAAKAAWYNQRREYRRLRQTKCDDFWRHRVDACRSSPRLLWQAVDRILGRGKLPAGDTIDVEQFRAFFDEKVNRIRDATAGAPPPEFSASPAEVQLPAFSEVSANDIMTFIGRLPDKSSAADPNSTTSLKDIVDLVSPYISELFSRSLAAGYYPLDFNMRS